MSEKIKEQTAALMGALHEEMQKIATENFNKDNFNKFILALNGVPSMHIRTLFGEQFTEYLTSYNKLSGYGHSNVTTLR